MRIFMYCFRDFDEKEFFDEEVRKYDFRYTGIPDYPSQKNLHRAEGYDAVSVTPTLLTERMIQRLYDMGVRYILTRSIGYDHIDLFAAKKLGMGVSCVSYPPESVASYALMLMMMCLRKVKQTLDRAQVQDYSLNGKIGKDLSQCTVGVVGTGSIGAQLIKYLQPFTPRVLAYDIKENPDLKGLCEYVPLEYLTQQSDIISLHANVTDLSHFMVDGTFLSNMKEGSYIVNTARGSLIDSDALITFLENGHLGGAALDVLEDEAGLYYYNRVGECISNQHMSMLRSYPNVILTPHTAFYTRQTVQWMAKNTIRALFDMSEGFPNRHVIVRPEKRRSR